MTDDKPAVPAARPVFPPDDRRAITELIDRLLASGSLTLGPLTEAFEDAFAERHQVRNAVAVSSGTAALEILLRTFGVAGREVIVPANTFFATAAAVVHAGGIPRLADVDRDTMALSTATLEAALATTDAAATTDADAGNPAGVIAVHIGGLVSDELPAIADLCRRRGMFLIEDAAHAHGAGLGGRSAGTFGDAAAFSFYPTKVMTSGEGGMIVTNDDAIRDEARIYRDQGKGAFLGGDHVRMGYAWRMSELHAAVGLVQLRRLDEFLAVRRNAAATYDTALSTIDGLEIPARPRTAESNFYKYPVMLAAGIDRSALKAELRDRHRVSLSGEVYAAPLHHHPVFADARRAPLPMAEDVCARHICLPVHSDITELEVEQVVDALAHAFPRRVTA